MCIKAGMPKCMPFVDDKVLLEESREGANSRPEVGKEDMESNGFQLDQSIIEYMKCKFNKRQISNDLELKIQNHIVQKVSKFRYLELILQSDRDIDAISHIRFKLGG